MNKRTRSLAALTATALLVSACGGVGDDSASQDETRDDVVETVADTTPPTEPPVTDPPVTEPPVTEPPVTAPPEIVLPATVPRITAPPVTEPPADDLPEWASGDTTTVETDAGPLELLVEIAPFCVASRPIYVAGNGIRFLGEGDFAGLKLLFSVLTERLPQAIETAPSAELAVQPTAARDQLAIIVPALESLNYDVNRIGELPNADEVSTATGDFTDVLEGLREFLINVCGADGELLAEQSMTAAEIAGGSAVEPAEPPAPAEPVEGTPLTNDASTIWVSVPTAWTEVQDTIVSGRDMLIAAPNMGLFSEVVAPGVVVLRGEGGLRDGGFVGRVLDFQSDLEERGCAMTANVDYDDGLYVGQERTFDCADDELNVRLLGGTTADESSYALVFLVHFADEPGVRQLIVDTFEVL